MEHGLAAVSGGKDPDKADLDTSSFPQFPGENFLAHEATQYKEQAEARFAQRQLLAVAQGFDPPSATSIVDVNLDELPELHESHRDHHRRHEARIKIMAQNKSNAEKRFQLVMEDRTKVYTLLKTSTESTAPVLSRELKELCDMELLHALPGGFFDGRYLLN